MINKWISWFQYANLDGVRRSNLKLPHAFNSFNHGLCFEGKQPPPSAALKTIIFVMAMLNSNTNR